MLNKIRKIEYRKNEIYILNQDGLVVRIPISEKENIEKYAKLKNKPKNMPEVIKELSNLGLLKYDDYEPSSQTIENYDDSLVTASGEETIYKGPIIAHLGITSRCNMRCKYCSVRQAHEKNSDELTTEEYKKIIKKLSDWGVFQIGFTGGEPTLRNDLEELTSYVSSLGVACNMTTNGWNLTEERANSLKKAGMLQAQVSLDSHLENIHEAFRNSGSYKRALNTIKILKNAGIKTGVDCVLSKNNINEIKDFIEYLNKEKIEGLTLIKLKQGDLPLNIFKNMIPGYEDYGKLIDYICKRKNYLPEVTIDCGSVSNLNYSLTDKELKEIHSAGCPAGHTLISIAPNGDMYPCAALFSKKFYLGNALRDDLDEIWQKNQILRNLRNVKSLVNGKCKKCSRLDSCRGGCRGLALSFGSINDSDPTCERR